MKAGDLRHRVTFSHLRPGVQDPETGDMAESQWQDMATVWAQVVPLSVREFLQAASTQNEISARVVVRYSKITATVTVDDRLQHGADVYEIKGIMADPASGREYLTLVCAKVS